MTLSTFGSLAAIATTPDAIATLRPFCQTNNIPLYLPAAVASHTIDQPYEGALRDCISNIWPQYEGLIFGLAAGAVVRLIASLLKDKATDPAVVVIDPQGKFVVSLCGGHQGGGDRLARTLAPYWQAEAVITGATEALDLPAIDTLGQPWGWHKGAGDWTGVSAAIARRQTVEVIQEVGSTLWQEHLPPDHPFAFEPGTSTPQARVWISVTPRQFSANSTIPKVQWHPRVLWVGVGCERGTALALVEQAIRETLTQAQLAPEAIAGLATLDLKADEVAFQQFCKARNLPLCTFSSETLNDVAVPNPSEVVAQAVGTASVAEAAAIVASEHGRLLVQKQSFKELGQGGVTVAIALAEQEYTGRSGHLALVGMGPGALNQMTPAAQMAVVQADVIIGYGLYLELIQPLQRPGQIIEALPITQERERAERAVELAMQGLSVAVVSSGDCGIYGMAGLVLETLQTQGWDGKTPNIEVLPGITALQAAASRVGTPLMHDFCAISLSDLLTPWSVIEQRLKAAAQGDFVTALYNPRSHQRQIQIVTAQSIFLAHRNPATPVALVRSAYRADESMILTTLGEMLTHPIDMLTTVLIGNSNTRNYANWLITPRGYQVQAK
ncbi:MAG: precorrin-3B C(17)-methyltransferase [Spirulina sp. SIO3F2]|nr:precorrin-3B C(17)-methyltransferase [Spirulina sp. SIO3F2]